MVENPRQYMPLGTGYFTENSRWVSPKSERKKRVSRGQSKKQQQQQQVYSVLPFCTDVSD